MQWDEAQASFRPDPNCPPLGDKGQGFVTVAGAANGETSLNAILNDANICGNAAAKAAGFKGKLSKAPMAQEATERAMLPVWLMPQGAGYKLRSKAWLDYQNDVKVSDVQLAAQEGFTSVEHAKRYTTQCATRHRTALPRSDTALHTQTQTQQALVVAESAGSRTAVSTWEESACDFI